MGVMNKENNGGMTRSGGVWIWVDENVAGIARLRPECCISPIELVKDAMVQVSRKVVKT